jgi:hypothetical protein
MTTNHAKYNTPLIIAGILFIIWGIFGLMDSKNYYYSGYSTDGNYAITEVEKDSPAAVAGMEVGDILESSGGISMQDNKALSQRERAKIGESREYVINRNGEEQTLELTYSALPQKNKTLDLIGFIMGLLFVILGLYANSRLKTALSFSFAFFAVLFGFNFFNGPYINPGMLDQFIGAISLTIVLLSFAALAQFMLKYPPESPLLSKKNGQTWLYIPAAIVVAFFWIIILAQPDGTSTMNTIVRLLIGVFVLFYFGLALVTLIRKYLKASSSERQSTGLNYMLIGTVLGLLPILIYFTIQTISPKTILPGDDYVQLTFVLIPVFFTLGLLELNKGEESAA